MLGLRFLIVIVQLKRCMIFLYKHKTFLAPIIPIKFGTIQVKNLKNMDQKHKTLAKLPLCISCDKLVWFGLEAPPRAERA